MTTDRCRSLRRRMLASFFIASLSPAVVHADPPASLPVGFDFEALAARTRHAFRPDGAEWRGGSYAHEVRTGGSEWSLTPLVRDRDGHTHPGAPLEFVSQHVARGSWQLESRGGWRREATGAIVTALGDHVQAHLANTDAGVEESWRFDARPDGTGDLTMRIGVAGRTVDGADAHGVRFVSAAGDAVYYGAATWIDARGVQTQVATEFANDAIVIRVPARLLDASAYPAVLDPMVSPEIVLDTASGATIHEQHPAAARGDNFWAVVWEDSRVLSSGINIRGALLRPDGTVVSPAGIDILTENGDQVHPRIAWNGSFFSMVFTQVIDPSAPIRVEAIQLNEADLSQRGGQVNLSNATTGNEGEPDIACQTATGNCVVVWTDTRGSAPQIFAGVFLATGSPASGGGIQIAPGTPVLPQVTPAIAATAGGYMVAYVEGPLGGERVRGVTLTASATPGAAAPFVIGTGSAAEHHPAIAASATQYMVVWEDGRHAGFDLWARGFDNTGRAMGPGDFVVATGGTPRTFPAIDFDGYDFVTVWEDTGSSGTTGIAGARITPGGVVIAPDATMPFTVIAPSAVNEHTPWIVADRGAGTSLVAYSSQPGTGTFYGARAILLHELGQGAMCSHATDCATGFCVDGVCCNAACGGGLPTDCEACSATAGGLNDGVCVPARAGTACVVAINMCSAHSTCDGTSPACLSVNVVDGGGCAVDAGASDASDAAEPDVSQVDATDSSTDATSDIAMTGGDTGPAGSGPGFRGGACQCSAPGRGIHFPSTLLWLAIGAALARSAVRRRR